MDASVPLSGRLRLDGCGRGKREDDRIIPVTSHTALLWRYLGLMNLSAESVVAFWQDDEGGRTR
jgi:hypothetical protein